MKLEQVHWPCDRKSPDSLRFICDPVRKQEVVIHQVQVEYNMP